MNKREIIALCKERGLHPSKKLGQNFLVSAGAAKRIMERLALTVEDRVLEVGPGLGALTGELLAAAGHCTAVEIDAGLARYLGGRFAGAPNFTLVHGDFLRETLPDDFTVIVSNLPYYCSSEMLFRFAVDFSAPRVCVMLQKELGDRIVSRPGSKAYGALTVNLGFHFTASVLFSVPGSAFYPVPEVSSSFMLLRRREEPMLEGPALRELYHRIVRSAFWGRRKTLAKALSESPHVRFPRDAVLRALEGIGRAPDVRGEALSLEEFAAITGTLEGEECT
jgi:16S rRNA (adenine1518-N6/adenine1519-N6)-dimethyltransferase